MRPAGIESAFQEEGADCSHLMILEAESRGPRVDRQMVHAAWDFERINARYQRHMELLRQFPAEGSEDRAGTLIAWAKEENAAWLAAIRADPLLPENLLPDGYLGLRAWLERKPILARAGQLAEKLAGGPKRPDE